MAEPLGPEPSRADVLGRLRRERWFAENAGEHARVAEIDAQILRLSAAGSPSSPLRETAADAPVRRERAARTSTKPAAKKGTARVRSAR